MAKNDNQRVIKCGPANPRKFIRELVKNGKLKGIATVHLAFEEGKCHILSDYTGDVDVEKFEDAFALGALELANFIRDKGKTGGTVH